MYYNIMQVSKSCKQEKLAQALSLYTVKQFLIIILIFKILLKGVSYRSVI